MSFFLLPNTKEDISENFPIDFNSIFHTVEVNGVSQLFGYWHPKRSSIVFSRRKTFRFRFGI